jgi:multidrug efflux system outer membrane protein
MKPVLLPVFLSICHAILPAASGRAGWLVSRAVPRAVSHLVALLLPIGLLACSSVPGSAPLPAFDLPATLTPDGVATSLGPRASVDAHQWWQHLQDPVLDALMAEALANNQDLALAAGRVAEARALLAASSASHYPTLDANASANKSRTSQETSKLPAGANPVARNVQLGLTAAYEIDFWGKLAAADGAARARLLAGSANRAALQMSLQAELAQRYLALRAADARLTLAQAVLDGRTENRRLQQLRLAAGLVGQLEKNTADLELASAQAALTQVRQQVANGETALALLLGRKPQALTTPHIARGKALAELLQNLRLPAELPANLLAQRPDIVAAEQNLLASRADLAQARALYFPSVRLAATLGREARNWSDLFDPKALLWNLGSTVTAPLFRGGALDAGQALASAREQQAVAQYRQSVHNAFADVHLALTNLSANAELAHDASDRLASLQASERLAQLRLAKGYGNKLDYLNAVRERLLADSALQEARMGHLQAMVALYRALGGGWEVNK